MLRFLFLCVVFVVVEGQDIGQNIVNGDVSEPHSFPWQLSLQRHGFHYCGAVLLNTQFALTAAHCVEYIEPLNDVVKCGAHNIHYPEDHRQRAPVTGVRIHPEYNPMASNPAYPNDIAVLRLGAGYLVLDEKCKPGTLASPGIDYTGRNATITGWGDVHPDGYLPSRLKVGKVKVLHPDDCYMRWGTNVDHHMHICFKDLGDKYYGMCHGDSGGPAQVGDIVVGIASFMGQGCLTEYPSVYVRVSSYIDWIMWAIGDLLYE